MNSAIVQIKSGKVVDGSGYVIETAEEYLERKRIVGMEQWYNDNENSSQPIEQTLDREEME